MKRFPKPDIALAGRMFDQLDAATRKGRGIVRESYGPGEQAAHDIIRRAGVYLDLEIHCDAAQNLYLTYPGRDRGAPSFITGSHLDSVDQGGNFDGAAGVVAGLAVLAGFRRAGYRPPADITVMAIRCEEGAWFDTTYVGSYAAFGAMPLHELEVPHGQSGRPLAEYMAAAGCNLEAIRAGEAYLRAEDVRGFIEVHIEQAPYLVENELPIGIVTGIRGVSRHRDARCLGAYGHSGALTRAQRRDAVKASVALLQNLNDEWRVREAAGRDLVFTVGEFMTNPQYHGPSKVAGETRFVLDFRSTDEGLLHELSGLAEARAAEIGVADNVRFDLGTPSFSEPAIMDARVRRTLSTLARELGIPSEEMPSGAAHDAVVFANFGIPTGMIFIRNENGSHNPEESMTMEDFAKAAELLSAYLIVELGEEDLAIGAD